jgi:formate hydrogenlyase subunit 3/multisubunit Na+/H+ antiporter MnhD subunit
LLNWIGFLWIFVLPIVLPLISIGVLSTVRRKRLPIASALLVLIGSVGAAPLAYSVWASPYAEGLAISSLVLYPLTLVAIICTLAARAFVAWRKGARAGH